MKDTNADWLVLENVLNLDKTKQDYVRLGVVQF